METLRVGRFFEGIDDFPGDDGCYGAAFEGAPIERGIARLACGVGGAERPLTINGEDSQVGRLIGGDGALDAENTGRTRGEEFDQAHQCDAAGVNELLEREGQRRLKSGDAEGRAVELYIF